MSTEALVSSMLSHRDITSYLGGYVPEEWPEVLQLTLLYGMYSLQALHTDPVPLTELQAKTRRASTLVNANSVIPQLKEQLQQMRADISKLEEGIQDPPVVVQALPAEDKPKPAKRVTWKNADYRTGDNSVFTGTNNTNSIYPDWWIGLSDLNIKQQKLPEKITQRQPPPLPPKKVKTVDFWAQAREPRPPKKAKKADKSVEADLESRESEVVSKSSSSRPQSTKHAWVGDYSDTVKRSPARFSQSREYYKPPSHPIKEPTLKSSLEEKSSGRWGEPSYTSSSMSNCNPSEEMKQFYRTEFKKLLESGGSLESSLGKKPAVTNPSYLRSYSSDSEENSSYV